MLDKKQIDERTRLGAMLVNQGYLTEEQLNKALQMSRNHQQMLGEVLTECGFVSARQLRKVLRRQKLYRYVLWAALALATPVTSYAGMQQHNDTASEVENVRGKAPMETSVDFARHSSMISMDETALSAVNGQGIGDDLVNELAAPGTSAAVTETLALLARSAMPLSDFFDAEVEVSGVEYDQETGLAMALNDDGSYQVNLPKKVKKLVLKDLRLKGSDNAFGDVMISNLDLRGSSVRVSFR